MEAYLTKTDAQLLALSTAGALDPRVLYVSSDTGRFYRAASGYLLKPWSGDDCLTPFSPSTSDTDKATSIASAAEVIPSGVTRLLIQNRDATDAVRIRFGDSSVTATTTTGVRVRPGTTQEVVIPALATYWARIAEANTPGVSVVWGV